MQDFPQKTFFNKPIPKAKFYEKLPVTQAVKNCFVNEIAGIVWRNKLSAETLNLRLGSRGQDLEDAEKGIIRIHTEQQGLCSGDPRLYSRGTP